MLMSVGLCCALGAAIPNNRAEARPWTPVGQGFSLLADVPPPASKPETSVTKFDGGRPTPYAVTVYAGKSVRGRFTKLFWAPWDTDLENDYLLALSLSARLFELTDHLSLEIEANVARRFGEAELWEFAVPLILRWDDFPWNDTVYTTIGLSFLGPSYATEISATERRKSHNDKGSHWLNFFAPEITLSPPDDPGFAFVGRIHHRSGAFGLINGVSGGSSYVSLGVRYRF